MKRMTVVLVALGVAAATATATATMQVAVVGEQDNDKRPGPDSARVAAFFATLRSVDQGTCEMLSDQIGNFWWSDSDVGIGQFGDARRTARAAKDSLSGEVTDPRAITLLSATLGDDDPCVRLVAAKMLGNSEKADDAVARALGSNSARVREAALRAAGERDERVALRPRVEKMLEDEPAVAAMAAWALGNFEQKASVGPLRRVLTHASPRVRAAAAHALGDIEDASVAPDLERLVENDADRGVRVIAIEALGSLDLPDGKAPDALLKTVESTDQRMRYAALEVLFQFDEDDRLIPIFLRFVKDPKPEVRRNAIEQLGSLGAEQAVPAIKAALNDPDPEVRRAAVEALAEIDDK